MPLTPNFCQAPPTPRDRREDLEQLRQLGLREGILNRNSLNRTQAKRDFRLTGASAAHTKGVDASTSMRVTSDKGTEVRRRGVWEEYRGVGDVSVVGCVGSLIVATRGVAGPGEVLLNVRGSKEAYLAWSEQPLPRGTEVLVIDIRGARTLLVEPWTL
jgi:hypothetical protein